MEDIKRYLQNIHSLEGINVCIIIMQIDINREQVSEIDMHVGVDGECNLIASSLNLS